MTENGKIGAVAQAPQPREQRRHIRREVPLDAQFVLPDGTEVQGEIENISAGGALIKAKANIKVGDRLVVRIRQIGHFPAVVARRADNDVAVEFKIRRERAARIADKLICLVNGTEKDAEDRVELRAAGQFISHLHFKDGRSMQCEVIDFSTSGAAVAVSPMPAVGTELRLGKTPARVVRADDGVVGLSFARIEENTNAEDTNGARPE